jgi:hypothetical protein
LTAAFIKGVFLPFLATAKTGVFLVFLEIVMFSGDRACPVLEKSNVLGTS